jgi:hypothetical protein
LHEGGDQASELEPTRPRASAFAPVRPARRTGSGCGDSSIEARLPADGHSPGVSVFGLFGVAPCR